MTNNTELAPIRGICYDFYEKRIGTEWFEIVKLSGEMISDINKIELAELVSKNYFEARKRGDFLFFEDLYSTDLRFTLAELSLAYEIVSKVNLELLPQAFTEESEFLVQEDYFWFLEGGAQSFVFHHLSTKSKETLIEVIMSTPIFWGDESILDRHPQESFKFDQLDVELIISYLSAQEDFCSSKDQLLSQNHHYFSPIYLVDYLHRDQASCDLWLEYLRSDKPNRMYAADVLMEMGDRRAIEYLSKLEEEALFNHFKENLSPHQECEEKFSEPEDFF